MAMLPKYYLNITLSSTTFYTPHALDMIRAVGLETNLSFLKLSLERLSKKNKH